MDLATRCRPSDLSGIWGNKETVDSLTAILSREDASHTFLFYGHSGCGKTTLARACCNFLKIEDVTEINGSDKNGIDDVRLLIQDAQLMGFEGKKAYIYDEVHYATANAQSGLLKLLEEPPRGVWFFLCTTDPQKLSVALKNRCQKFEVKQLTDKVLRRNISALMIDEDIELPDEIVDAIIEKSEGIPRTALKLLDKVRDMKDKDKAMELIESEGSLESDDLEIIQFCRTLYGKPNDWNGISAQLKIMKTKDVETVRRTVLGYCNAILMNKADAKAATIISYMAENFYDSGLAGLALACYQIKMENLS